MGEEKEVEFRKVCGMKNIHLFFVCIIIIPLAFGVVLITYAEALMIRTYFQTTIENISSQIQEQTFAVQSEMMSAYKYYLTTYYKETFSDLFRIRNLVNVALEEDVATPTTSILKRITDQTASSTSNNVCLESANIAYSTFPLCTDMNYLTDYKMSTDPYKINMGHAFTILNGDLNGNNDRSTIQTWRNNAQYNKELAMLMALSPVMTSFTDNRLENVYSATRYDRSMTSIATPNGLYGSNYFNYQYVNDIDIPNNGECASLHTTMPPMIKYDPRCRSWFRYALMFSCRVIRASTTKLSGASGNFTIEPYSNYYPIIVAPQPDVPAITPKPMRAALLMINKLSIKTVTTPLTCDNALINQKATYVIMKEIYVYSVMNMIAKSFSRPVFNLLYYTEDNAEKQAKAATLQTYFNNLLLKDSAGTPIAATDPQDYILWVRQVSQTMGDIYRIYLAFLYTSPVPDTGTSVGALSYKYMMDSRYNDWYDNNVNPGAGGTLGAQTADVKQQMEAEKLLMEKFLTDNIKFSEIPLPLSKVTTNVDFPKSASGGVLQMTKAQIVVDSLGTVDITTKRYVEVFRIIYVVPDSLITDKYKVLIGIIDQQIFNNAIISFSIIVFFLLVGLYAVLRFASKLTLHLNETLEVAEKVEKSQPIYQDKDDLNKNMNYEVQESKNALFKLNNIFNATSGPSNAKEKDKDQEANDQNNVLKYAFQIKLFTMLNDKRMIGILCNNLANLHFNSGRYLEAVEKYQESIDYLDAFNSMSTSDKMLISDDEYISTKCDRMMNMCYALKRYTETTGDKQTTKLDKLKKAANFVKDKVSESNYDRQIKCLILLAWVGRYKDDTQPAISNLSQAIDRFNRNKAMLDQNVSFMYLQEIDYERAMNNIKEKKYAKALALITQSLIRDEHFEIGLRVKLVRLLVDVFGLLKQPLTPGIMDLKERFLEKNPIRRYVIALDYSASMKVAGKIDNSIKAILTIWDQFIRPNDKACFCRFNINCDAVFNLEEKGLNTFAKRIEIEKSNMPRDRTSFFDALYKCCTIIKNDRTSLPTKNYIVLFCDGDDTSSLKQQKDAMEIVSNTNVTLVAIGLGLKGDMKTKQMMQAAAKASKGGIYIDIFDNNFEILFQVISQYANSKPYNELIQE
jgi:tetratricopeptide (TPR) repeat protein